MSPFYIRIQVDRKDIRLKVEQRNLTDSHEEFVVTARNGIIVMKSNRPLLRGKGIKKRDPDFNIIVGKLMYANYERQIIKAIIDYLDKYEKENIPITFEHRGKTFSGHFGRVLGAGSNDIWSLYCNGQYLGNLRKGWQDEWVFEEGNSTFELKYLSRFFANYLYEKGVL